VLLDSRNTKIIVDILMTIFLLLSFVRWDGDPTFHYVVGTACVLFFCLHIFIHRKWIKAVTKSCLIGKLTKALKWKYIIDIFLLVMWGISIITGFLAIGPYISGSEGRSVFGGIHGVSSRIGLLLIIIHIVQHRIQIISYFKKQR